MPAPPPPRAIATEHYQWACNHPEVQRACFFARICEHVGPRKCLLTEIEPILQHGPVCGLICISMLMNGLKTAKELLEEARERKYSQNGEMFSAYYLFKLLESQNMRNSTILYHDGPLNSDAIRNRLKNGNMLLVPYDPDRNHTPTNMKGHKAHWALIVGLLIDDDDRFHVFARHGKTLNLALWSLDDLAESNSNLVEFKQPALHPNDVFIVPDGGLDGRIGLRNKCIIVIDGRPKVEVV